MCGAMSDGLLRPHAQTVSDGDPTVIDLLFRREGEYQYDMFIHCVGSSSDQTVSDVTYKAAYCHSNSSDTLFFYDRV